MEQKFNLSIDNVILSDDFNIKEEVADIQPGDVFLNYRISYWHKDKEKLHQFLWFREVCSKIFQECYFILPEDYNAKCLFNACDQITQLHELYCKDAVCVNSVNSDVSCKYFSVFQEDCEILDICIPEVMLTYTGTVTVILKKELRTLKTADESYYALLVLTYHQDIDSFHPSSVEINEIYAEINDDNSFNYKFNNEVFNDYIYSRVDYLKLYVYKRL